MINSLSKDSHITLPNAFPKIKHSDRNSSRNYVQSAHVNHNEHKNDIFLNKPADVSLAGFFNAKPKEIHVLIDNFESIPDGVIRKILSAAKKFTSEQLKINPDTNLKEHRSAVRNLVEGAVDFMHKEGKEVDENVSKFMSEDGIKSSVESLLEQAKKFAQKKEKNKLIDIDFQSQEYKDFVKNEVGNSIDVLHSIEGKEKRYQGKFLHELLKKANSNQGVFSAMFAVALTCFLRPLTIVALPGKKGKDDKKYASAHSFSSGVIGYLFAVAVSSPLVAGLVKIAKNPEKYLTKDKHEYLLKRQEYINGVVNNVTKEFKDLSSLSKFKVASKYINMIPDTILGPPKAIITIALIPPILNMFGIEKKVPVNAQNVLKPTQNYLAINFRGANSSESASTSNSEVK